MRIGIDLRFTAASCMGTGTYAETAALALASVISADDTLIGFVDGDPISSPLAGRIALRHLSNRFAGTQTITAHRLLFDSAIAREHLDVFFSPSGIAPLRPTCPVVITIHDLLFEKEPSFFGEQLFTYLKREVPRSAKAADGIIAVSAMTKHEVIARYGIPTERIQVTHQSLRDCFRTVPAKPAIAKVLADLKLRRPYILTLSNHAPHKNTAFTIDVFSRWLKQTGDTKHRLVIAGGGPAPNAPIDLEAVAANCGITDRVTICGRVSDGQLLGLLAGASTFLFPSRYEGWGLPPLEAIAMGTPVITSDRGALPEAIADAGIVLSLDDRSEWVTTLTELLAKGPSTTLRHAMEVRTAQVFAPQGTALLQALREAIERHQQGTARTLDQATPSVDARSPGEAPNRTHENGNRQVADMAGGPPDDSLRKIGPSRPAALPPHGGRIFVLSGCMIIKNGVRLGYPFVEAIHAVIGHVEEMAVVDGGSDDETWSVLERMAAVCPTLRISQQPWPATVVGGKVIAEASNHALRQCRGSHILYVQADEIHTRTNLDRLRTLIAEGFDYAAMPFLHFRSSWWKVIANPAYTATIRCIPNRPDVVSVDDGTTFRGPSGRCAQPEAFPDSIFHVGWVYAANIVAKHANHALIYRDHADYQVKAQKASQLPTDQTVGIDLESIDSDYQLLAYRGRHPAVIAHLIDQDKYRFAPGLERWVASFSSTQGEARRTSAGSVGDTSRASGAS